MNKTKRVLDMIIVILLFPLFLAISAMVSLAIKADSPGQILYVQKRIGKGGKLIRMYKFRTMKTNNININKKDFEKIFKLKEDPRITRVGSFLRKSSLDEIPQVLNILKGEMSLVGPRPIIPDEIKCLSERDMRYYISTEPGLTGLWQVSGRNNLSYKKRIRLNNYYVKNQSLWLDIKIIIKTIKVVISREGAY